MSGVAAKNGRGFHDTKLLLCENPLPLLDEAIAAAQAELPCSPRRASASATAYFPPTARTT